MKKNTLKGVFFFVYKISAFIKKNNFYVKH